MRRIFALLLALALLLSMLLIFVIPVPASAVTPPLRVPDMPEIPDLSNNVEVNLSDDFWGNHFRNNPFKIDWSKFKFDFDWSGLNR